MFRLKVIFSALLISSFMCICSIAEDKVFDTMDQYCDYVASAYGKREGRQCIKSYVVSQRTDIDATEKMLVGIIDAIMGIDYLTVEDLTEIEEAKQQIREELFNTKIQLFDYANSKYK